VLLDEIAEMCQGSQAKILRTLQENAVRRIGGTEEIPIHCRVIVATNRNLKRLVEEGTFRQDLFYRINVLPIHVPPLRERSEDISLLVDHFLLKLAAGLGKTVQRFAPKALEKLARHAWPGNVRELKNVVERAAILCEDDAVGLDCILVSHELEGGAGAAARGMRAFGPERSLREQVAAFEKGIISDALGAFGSVRGTARRLGISHTALLKKVRKYGL
jgi:transcriptional regulator of aroF, aroG, tyrA and aromatic amino acid transport